MKLAARAAAKADKDAARAAAKADKDAARAAAKTVDKAAKAAVRAAMKKTTGSTVDTWVDNTTMPTLDYDDLSADLEETNKILVSELAALRKRFMALEAVYHKEHAALTAIRNTIAEC